jgi:hypothetical protein
LLLYGLGLSSCGNYTPEEMGNQFFRRFICVFCRSPGAADRPAAVKFFDFFAAPFQSVGILKEVTL